jgi:hypothetical protein
MLPRPVKNVSSDRVIGIRSRASMAPHPIAAATPLLQDQDPGGLANCIHSFIHCGSTLRPVAKARFLVPRR